LFEIVAVALSYKVGNCFCAFVTLDGRPPPMSTELVRRPAILGPAIAPMT